MAGFVYPLSAQITYVTAIQVPYLTGKVRLFASPIAFTSQLTQAELVAIEANFTGYTEKTLTTLPAPYPDLQYQGVSFVLPTQTFAVGATPTVFNQIYGGWIEDSMGNLLVAWQVTMPIPMTQALAALPLEMVFNFFGLNTVLVQINGSPV